MTSLFALLISTLALSHVPIIPDEPQKEVVYFYAEAPEQQGSADILGGEATRKQRFMIIPPPVKHVNIWKTIKQIFPPIDLSERG